jgi:tetratricopeptide (TPR) repeat protein
MSTLTWLAWGAGLWVAFVLYRWRRDVVHQQRGRARDKARQAAGKLPPYHPPWTRFVLTALWVAAVYASVSLERPTGHVRVAWVLAGLPLVLWAALASAARWNLKRGHYAAALRSVGVLLFVAPDSATLLRRRGEILREAGRLEEAGGSLKKALAQAHKDGQQVRAMECLGKVLTAQGRCQEAARAIELALKVMPRRSGLHAAFAETLLWQPAEPEEALARVNRALDYEGKARHKSGPNSFAATWAAQAWALGLLGRRAPMLQAVRRALEASDDSERPLMAGVHYRLGMALRSAGEEAAAVKSFEDACATDPVGLYGTLAARALGKTP